MHFLVCDIFPSALHTEDSLAGSSIPSKLHCSGMRCKETPVPSFADSFFILCLSSAITAWRHKLFFFNFMLKIQNFAPANTKYQPRWFFSGMQ